MLVFVRMFQLPPPPPPPLPPLILFLYPVLLPLQQQHTLQDFFVLNSYLC